MILVITLIYGAKTTRNSYCKVWELTLLPKHGMKCMGRKDLSEVYILVIYLRLIFKKLLLPDWVVQLSICIADLFLHDKQLKPFCQSFLSTMPYVEFKKTKGYTYVIL